MTVIPDWLFFIVVGIILGVGGTLVGQDLAVIWGWRNHDPAKKKNETSGP